MAKKKTKKKKSNNKKSTKKGASKSPVKHVDRIGFGITTDLFDEHTEVDEDTEIAYSLFTYQDYSYARKRTRTDEGFDDEYAVVLDDAGVDFPIKVKSLVGAIALLNALDLHMVKEVVEENNSDIIEGVIVDG
jgi:hypothetical protein